MNIRTTVASTNPYLRAIRCMWRQKRKALHCPTTPRLEGKTVLVTGGTSGVGLETARGLLARGADVAITARNAKKADNVADQLSGPCDAQDRITTILFDLADLTTTPEAIGQVSRWLGGRTIDIVIENAGMTPTENAETAQGYEIAFGTNVLGHHALRAGLIRDDLLSTDARVVIVTGDIYVMQSECTPDFRYKSASDKQRAYCRSKLGNIWIANELRRRYEELNVYIVHPGVIASGLGGRTGFQAWLMNKMMPSPIIGAQTSLICATQDGLENGGCYHNTQGLMKLQESDPAMDAAAASRLWDLCDVLLKRSISNDGE